MKSEDIEIGDLLMVIAKPHWDSYIYVLRVKEMDNERVYGVACGKSCYNHSATFSFENNSFFKLDI